VYIKRTAEEALKSILRGDKIGIVLGARQVGKAALSEDPFVGEQLEGG